MPERPVLNRSELDHQLVAHKQWLDSDGAQGHRVDLSGQLLVEMDLRGVDLRQANLSGAKLDGSMLADAKLQGAELRQTSFLNADLSNADLTDIHGLAFHNLAGADLTGTILPASLAPGIYFENFKDFYNNAKNLYNFLLVASGYSILTILITTDDRMLRNVSASPLPFIGTEAPVLWFYVLMPIVITSLYVFLISGIGRLWKMLQQLPAIFPDGSDLTMMPYCWILTDAARQAMPLLRVHSKNQRIAQNSLQCLILFSLPIFSLLMFWWYYIPLRNEAVTWLHVVLITVCLLITFIFFYRSIWNRTFDHMKRGAESPRKDSQQHTRSAILQQVVLPLVSVLVGVSLATIVYFISFKVFDANADRTALQMDRSCPPDASLQLLCQMKHRSYIDVRYKALSSRPSDWNDPANIADIEWGGGEEDAAKIRRFFGPVDGVDLRAFNLSYADAQYTFLAKARLEDAILDRADLKFADLRLAYMDRAQAKGAYLSRADLRRARLIGANLEGGFSG